MLLYFFSLTLFGEPGKFCLTERRDGKMITREYWNNEVLVLPADGSRPFALEVESSRLVELKDRLEKSPSFAWVGFSPVLRLQEGDVLPLANDPMLSEQWALTKKGINWFYDEGLDLSHVYVGLVDTGSCPEHEDMNPLFWRWTYFKRLSEQVADKNGHGCSVSSVVNARANNGLWLTGIADKANLISIEALDPGGSATTGDLIKGLYAFLDKTKEVKSQNPKARFILNLSFGLPESIPPLNRAVQDLVDSGVIVVIAAGNDGLDLTKTDYSPSAQGAIVVGALDQGGKVPAWSNFGENVDLFAPGVDVLVAGMFQTLSKKGEGSGAWHSGVAFARGTSFAAPHVVGAIAVMLGRHPKLSLSQVREMLLSSCRKLETGCALDWSATK